MKKALVAYLSKPDLNLEDLIDINNSTSPKLIGLDNEKINLFVSRNNFKPKWSDLFDDVVEDRNVFDQTNSKAVLTIEYSFNTEKRFLIFTFGYAKSLISVENTEKGFGLRVAMNLGDPNQLKSIDSATLVSRVPRNTRSQVALRSSVEDFNFHFDHDILKSITAVIDEEDKENAKNKTPDSISGSDSVRLSTEFEIKDMESLGKKLLDAYYSIEYIEKYPWAEVIKFVTDKEVSEELDYILLEKLSHKNIDGIYMSPSKIVDYDRLSGFSYKKRSSKGSSVGVHLDLDLLSYLNEVKLKKSIETKTLRSKKIFLYDDNDHDYEYWSFYETLNLDLYLKGEQYILNGGRWYKIQSDFYNKVEDYFLGIKKRHTEMPAYFDNSETEYLNRISDQENYVLLDQKWIRTQGSKDNFEFCDLITPNNEIIHVKKYGSSSIFSHLFSQATVSAEHFQNDASIVSQVNRHLNGECNCKIKCKESYVTLKKQKEESYIITFAVIDPKVRNKNIHRKDDIHMPFFSKVNLRYQATNLINKGFSVNLTKISVDKEKQLRLKD